VNSSDEPSLVDYMREALVDGKKNENEKNEEKKNEMAVSPDRMTWHSRTGATRQLQACLSRGRPASHIANHKPLAPAATFSNPSSSP